MLIMEPRKGGWRDYIYALAFCIMGESPTQLLLTSKSSVCSYASDGVKLFDFLLQAHIVNESNPKCYENIYSLAKD